MRDDLKKDANFLLILPRESGIIKVVQTDAPVCRNGRRGGLKIPCANNTCGFDPHHRHKKGTPPACLGEFSFLSAACERVEQHGPAKECSGNVNRPHLPVRMVYRSGNGAVLFLCGSFCFLSAASPARADSSVPPYSVPAEGRFCPPHLWPGFPMNGRSFCRKVVLCPGKSTGRLHWSFILPFLTDFTMFFAKKALQMNFKNILYNYRFNFFTQIVSYRFVWGSRVCAFCTASALR